MPASRITKLLLSADACASAEYPERSLSEDISCDSDTFTGEVAQPAKETAATSVNFALIGPLDQVPAPSAGCPKSPVAAIAGPTIIGCHESEMIRGVRP
jgi:hypothetical protein